MDNNIFTMDLDTSSLTAANISDEQFEAGICEKVQDILLKEFPTTRQKQNIKTEYVIHAIAENECIIIKDEEINNEIQNYLNNGYFETEENLFEYMTREEIATNLQYYKIRDFIYNNAITK